ncbi:MAG: hypothetical protein PF693_17225 [Spirochaetia bacterium]|nr:hypothetical protein [Spirochaetia bacterium]
MDTAEHDESEGSTTMPSPDELKDKIKQAQEAVDAADNIIAPTPEMTPDQVESAREIENR